MALNLTQRRDERVPPQYRRHRRSLPLAAFASTPATQGFILPRTLLHRCLPIGPPRSLPVLIRSRLLLPRSHLLCPVLSSVHRSDEVAFDSVAPSTLYRSPAVRHETFFA